MLWLIFWGGICSLISFWSTRSQRRGGWSLCPSSATETFSLTRRLHAHPSVKQRCFASLSSSIWFVVLGFVIILVYFSPQICDLSHFFGAFFPVIVRQHCLAVSQKHPGSWLNVLMNSALSFKRFMFSLLDQTAVPVFKMYFAIWVPVILAFLMSIMYISKRAFWYKLDTNPLNAPFNATIFWKDPVTL